MSCVEYFLDKGYTKESIFNVVDRLSFSIANSNLGIKKENIEISIDFYKQLLYIYDQAEDPENWLGIQINLGIAYRSRILGIKNNNLNKAIYYYENALDVCKLTKNIQIEATVHNNLGNIYRDIVGQNKKINLEKAIKHHNAALKACNKLEDPQMWATIQYNIGLSYWERIKGNRINNIEIAIKAYKKALEVRTKSKYPEDWAITQNNLGIAHHSRIYGDRKENIRKAIDCYEAALKIYSEIDFPIDWARTQINLGNTFLSLFMGDKISKIDTAIYHYKLALKIYTKSNFPQEWAIIQGCLGVAYYKRLKGNNARNIEIAICYFKLALKIISRLNCPEKWVSTQNNLGTAYADRIEGNEQENTEIAIVHFTNSLEVTNELGLSQKLANTHNCLGNAYSQSFSGDRQKNIRRAIYHFKASLTIHTPQNNPIELLRNSSNLGNLAFIEGDWKLSFEAYSISVKAVEQSCEWATNDQNRQEIISNAIAVYQNIVQACINLGQIDKAIEYVERGKARNLVGLLATRDLYPKGNIPQEVIDRLDTLRQATIVEERRLNQQRDRSNGFGGFSIGDNRGLGGIVGNEEALNRDRLNQIRQELEHLNKEHIQPIDPSFQLTQKVEPISFEKIKEALPTEQTVLIEWFIGNNTLSAFIVTRQQETPFHLDYTGEQFQALGEVVDRYYDSYRKRDGQWHSSLPSLLTQLAQNLQIETIIEQIKQLVPDCDRLILVPHRWLHLLPIHALPLPDGKCLLDLFPQGVSYAPSVQLLELTQKQSKPQLNNLFAVQNPTEDLEFTDVEVKAVRSHFQPNDDVLKKQQATKSALTKEKLGQVNLAHFSCHGKFNFENPELSALLLAGSKLEQNQEDKNKGKTRFLPSRDGGSIDLDKCLTLGEIFGLDLRNCRLVTLSACETGLTDFRSLSDEYIGLPSGFLYAGSPSVVSSLWTVDDIATSFLMIKFYQNLQSIDSVAIALNQAQLWLRSVTKEELEEWKTTLNIGSQIWKVDAALINMSDGDRPYESPYYWAAFCAVGQ